MKLEKIITKIIGEINRENRGDSQYHGLMKRGNIRAYSAPSAMLSWEETEEAPEHGIMVDPVTGAVLQTRCPDIQRITSKCSGVPIILTPCPDWFLDAATRNPLPSPAGDLGAVFFDGHDTGKLFISEWLNGRRIRYTSWDVSDFPSRPFGLGPKYLAWIKLLVDNDDGVHVSLYHEFDMGLYPIGVKFGEYTLTIMPCTFYE